MSNAETAIVSRVVAIYPDHTTAKARCGTYTNRGSRSTFSRSWVAIFRRPKSQLGSSAAATTLRPGRRPGLFRVADRPVHRSGISDFARAGPRRGRGSDRGVANGGHGGGGGGNLGGQPGGRAHRLGSAAAPGSSTRRRSRQASFSSSSGPPRRPSPARGAYSPPRGRST